MSLSSYDKLVISLYNTAGRLASCARRLAGGDVPDSDTFCSLALRVPGLFPFCSERRVAPTTLAWAGLGLCYVGTLAVVAAPLYL